MLVYFFCTLFQFVCCIKCNAGGAPPAGHYVQYAPVTHREHYLHTLLLTAGNVELDHRLL